MKLFFKRLFKPMDKEVPKEVEPVEEELTFYMPRPTIVQPMSRAEIMEMADRAFFNSTQALLDNDDNK
jgi:hypothetical protein